MASGIRPGGLYEYSPWSAPPVHAHAAMRHACPHGSRMEPAYLCSASQAGLAPCAVGETISAGRERPLCPTWSGCRRCGRGGRGAGGREHWGKGLRLLPGRPALGLGGPSAGVLCGDARVYARGHSATAGVVRLQLGALGRAGCLVPCPGGQVARCLADRAGGETPPSGSCLLGRLQFRPVTRARAISKLARDWKPPRR